MRVFSGLEMGFLVYLPLLWMVPSAFRAIRRPGVWHAISRAQVGTCFLLVYVLVVGLATSLVVANLGTFFRLRLLFWLPLLILVAAGDPLGGYRWLFERVARWRGTRVPVIEPVQGNAGSPLSPPEAVAGASHRWSD